MIDLRSDTVTKPTQQMREVMAEAEVGDDVFGEDPSINNLEQKVSAMFGFEDGLFVPSGTMANQLSVNVLTQNGEEVLIEEKGHIFNYESTASAHLSSVLLRTIKGRHGKLSAGLLTDKVRGERDWIPTTSVIALENSTNKGGGCCYAGSELSEIREFADEHNLSIHLDGARIWNAMIATDTNPEFYGSIADTMSVCFSKGLGAPVGSMILSSKPTIKEARKMRKMWGGGMRQAGILAAAADYAVDHHLSLIKEDHRRARVLAKTISGCSELEISSENIETNILLFNLKTGNASNAVEELRKEGIGVVPFGSSTLRATLHFQITDDDLEKVQKVFRKVFN